MGNIVQCCDSLSNYCKCKDAPAQGEAERSPLLSSEESECDSPSVLEDTGVTNPALEREHFLFPDIILSSSLGGDVTLVEPMVCLLVSEEEEGLDELRCDRQEKSNTERRGEYSEVETQTDELEETRIGMGVQTQTESQTEVQTQTERPKTNDETMKKEIKTLTTTGTTKDTEEHEIMAMPSEAHADTQTSQPGHLETIIEKDSLEKEERQSENNKLDHRDIDKEAKEEKLKLQPHNITADNTYFPQTERPELQTLVNVKDKEQKAQSESTSVMLTGHDVNGMTENTAAVESQKKSTQYSINHTDVEIFNLAERRAAVTQHKHDDEHMGEATVGSDQNQNKKDQNISHTTTMRNCSENHTDQTLLEEDHVENQDKETAGVVELKTLLRQLEQEGAKIEQMSLFLVDRTFLAPSRAKGVWFC